jgi:hypothetical protein
MLDAATVADLVYDQVDGDRGHGDDHRESLRGDLASSITPQEERVGSHKTSISCTNMSSKCIK